MKKHKGIKFTICRILMNRGKRDLAYKWFKDEAKTVDAEEISKIMDILTGKERV